MNIEIFKDQLTADRTMKELNEFFIFVFEVKINVFLVQHFSVRFPVLLPLRIIVIVKGVNNKNQSEKCVYIYLFFMHTVALTLQERGRERGRAPGKGTGPLERGRAQGTGRSPQEWAQGWGQAPRNGHRNGDRPPGVGTSGHRSLATSCRNRSGAPV